MITPNDHAAWRPSPVPLRASMVHTVVEDAERAASTLRWRAEGVRCAPTWPGQTAAECDLTERASQHTARAEWWRGQIRNTP